MKGISVIICCYNSALRLPETLQSLANQKWNDEVEWEIIVVNNASTDDTVTVCRRFWNENGNHIPMTIVDENRPGLTYARKRGMDESRYPILVLCDDDNWLCEMYLQSAYDLFNQDTQLVAIGGKGIPVFETEPPQWFEYYKEAYALGSQGSKRENRTIFNLYGAGLVLLKDSVISLFEAGFTPILSDRVGNRLSSAGDTELTNALVLAGYKLGYSEQLQFSHYMPTARLTTNYRDRLFVAFGSDGPIRNLYYSYLTNRVSHQLIKYWICHLGLAIFRLFKYLILPPKQGGRWVYFNWSKAYLKSLFSIVQSYGKYKRALTHLKSLKLSRKRYDNEPLKEGLGESTKLLSFSR